jgi:amino acid adenylation domain-containing protein
MNTSNLALPFLSKAEAAPQRVALSIGGRLTSYGELAGFARRIASWLLRSSSDGHVGIFAQRSLPAYAGVLGACIAGRPWVPLGVDLPLERQLEMVQRGGVRLLIADRAVDPRFRDAGVLAVLSPENLSELDALAPLERPKMVPASSVAYSMFTSGTTGKPKGVRVPVGALQHFLAHMRERFPLVPEDRVSQFYELYFDLSNFDIFHTLTSGASLHVVPESERMAPGRFIKDEKLTVWSSVPSALAFMARTKQLAPGSLPHLRAAMFCGEPLPVSSVEALQAAAPSCRVDNQYGPTEATVSCTGYWVEAPMRVTPSRAIVSIGQPFPGTRVGIVDPEGRFLPAGEKGELALAGAQLALGYDSEDLTARRFPTLVHPVHGAGRWYLTGDLAVEDEDGHFHHLGRLDHQVKVLGHRVELEEVETHLREVSGAQTVVVPWPVIDGAASGLVAFLVEGGWSGPAVRSAMAARVPAYMVPKRLIALPSLPAAPNGKLDRKALLRWLEQEKPGGPA